MINGRIVNRFPAVSASITIDEALELMRLDQNLCDSYVTETSCSEYPSPFWAYWFARRIICDKWITAEDLISTNHEINKLYHGFLFTLSECDMIGASLETHTQYQVDDYGIMIQSRFPIVQKYLDADIVSEQVEQFLNQRQNRHDDHDDHDE